MRVVSGKCDDHPFVGVGTGIVTTLCGKVDKCVGKWMTTQS